MGEFTACYPLLNHELLVASRNQVWAITPSGNNKNLIDLRTLLEKEKVAWHVAHVGFRDGKVVVSSQSPGDPSTVKGDIVEIELVTGAVRHSKGSARDAWRETSRYDVQLASGTVLIADDDRRRIVERDSRGRLVSELPYVGSVGFKCQSHLLRLGFEPGEWNNTNLDHIAFRLSQLRENRAYQRYLASRALLNDHKLADVVGKLRDDLVVSLVQVLGESLTDLEMRKDITWGHSATVVECLRQLTQDRRDLLLQSLESPRESVRAGALTILRQLQARRELASDAVTSVGKRLPALCEDKSPAVRIEAVQGVGPFRDGHPAGKAIELLSKRFRDSGRIDERSWSVAEHAVAQLAGFGESALPTLLEAAKSSDALLPRASWSMAVVALEHPALADKVSAILSKLFVETKNPRNRMGTLAAMARMGSMSRAAQSTLAKALEEAAAEEREYRLALIDTIRRLGTKDVPDEVVFRLCRVLSTTKATDELRTLIVLLGDLGPAARVAVADLENLRSNSDLRPIIDASLLKIRP